MTNVDGLGSKNRKNCKFVKNSDVKNKITVCVLVFHCAIVFTAYYLCLPRGKHTVLYLSATNRPGTITLILTTERNANALYVLKCTFLLQGEYTLK